MHNSRNVNLIFITVLCILPSSLLFFFCYLENENNSCIFQNMEAMGVIKVQATEVIKDPAMEVIVVQAMEIIKDPAMEVIKDPAM